MKTEVVVFILLIANIIFAIRISLLSYKCKVITSVLIHLIDEVKQHDDMFDQLGMGEKDGEKD